jgi:hypothetical protein
LLVIDGDANVDWSKEHREVLCARTLRELAEKLVSAAPCVSVLLSVSDTHSFQRDGRDIAGASPVVCAVPPLSDDACEALVVTHNAARRDEWQSIGAIARNRPGNVARLCRMASAAFTDVVAAQEDVVAESTQIEAAAAAASSGDGSGVEKSEAVGRTRVETSLMSSLAPGHHRILIALSVFPVGSITLAYDNQYLPCFAPPCLALPLFYYQTLTLSPLYNLPAHLRRRCHAKRRRTGFGHCS